MRQPSEGKGEIRVLLFVEDEAARDTYLRALADCGALVDVTPSFFDLSEDICDRSYHGLLIDLSTKMQAIRKDKIEVYRLAEKFPVAHLQRDRLTGEVRCYHVGRQSGDSPGDFIESQCRSFAPCKIRDVARTPICRPLLLCRDPRKRRCEKTFTVDLSSRGCFIFSVQRRRIDQEIYLCFPDLSDMTPIRARICSVIRWESCRRIPGIGVKFLDLSVSQREQLTELCRTG